MKDNFKNSAFQVILLFSVLCIAILIVATLSEIFLILSQSDEQRSGIISYENYDMHNSYEYFNEQHLHPFYYFFFPQSEEEIRRINNDIVSIDVNGFRGVSPEEKGDKKLAFILGGSAAFSRGSSSNQTTISGYLNSIQSKYHFVNAGVPSWNSTQEFYRLSLQLVQYNPSLIVVYDGFNDAIINYQYSKSMAVYPPGTPESYQYFERQFDDIRENKLFKLSKSKIVGYFFPRTISSIKSNIKPLLVKENKPNYETGYILSDRLRNDAERGAKAYLKNLELMQRMTTSYESKFVAVWQPSFFQHKNISSDNRKLLSESNKKIFIDFLKYFHEYTFAHMPNDLKISDMSEIFDGHYKNVPLGDIFIDQVHLSDAGNEIIANEIINILIKKELL